MNLILGRENVVSVFFASTNVVAARETCCRQQPGGETPGVAVAPVRLDAPTMVGETVSVWGYGLTSQINEPVGLRVRNGALVVGVGPDTPASTTQPDLSGLVTSADFVILIVGLTLV